MKVNDFAEWIRRMPALSRRQRAECISRLNREEPTEDVPQVVLDREVERCPHCGHHKLWRWGKANGLPRWRCQGCGKTFNVLTGTPLARLRLKEKWIDNAEAMIEGNSVRETARKCKVHRTTAFRWRHRFLQQHQKAQCKDLTGIAECDATYFRHSEKGSRNLQREPRKRGKHQIKSGVNKELVAVITLRDRSGKGAERIAIDKQQSLAAALFQTHLKPDTLLITDGSHELCKAAKSRGPDGHLALPVTENRGVKGSPFHLQTNNAYHSHLKVWMTRFKGVATKYLANYAGWHRHLTERTHQNNAETFILLSFSPLSINPQLTLT